MTPEFVFILVIMSLFSFGFSTKVKTASGAVVTVDPASLSAPKPQFSCRFPPCSKYFVTSQGRAGHEGAFHKNEKEKCIVRDVAIANVEVIEHDIQNNDVENSMEVDEAEKHVKQDKKKSEVKRNKHKFEKEK